MKMYSLFTRNVHTFMRNIREPGSQGSQELGEMFEGDFADTCGDSFFASCTSNSSLGPALVPHCKHNTELHFILEI